MMLNFIAYAEPRLEIGLMREAISVPQEVDKLENFIPKPGNILREDSITKLCKSLIRKSNDGRFFEFAHFSVQEFLNVELLSLPKLARFQISEATCDQLLAVQCLRYLQLKSFDHWPKDHASELQYMATRSEEYPMYDHAAEMWAVYARNAWAEGSVADTAMSLFNSGSNTSHFKSWAVQLVLSVGPKCEPPRSRRRWSSRMDSKPRESRPRSYSPVSTTTEDKLVLLSKVMSKNFSTLHVAAALSLPTVCSSLLENGADVNEDSPFGCPLQCAVQGLFLASFHTVRS